jgi:hypothetical protein
LKFSTGSSPSWQPAAPTQEKWALFRDDFSTEPGNQIGWIIFWRGIIGDAKRLTTGFLVKIIKNNFWAGLPKCFGNWK